MGVYTVYVPQVAVYQLQMITGVYVMHSSSVGSQVITRMPMAAYP